MSGRSKGADSRRKDEQFDLEQQLILRLPPGQAMALSHELSNGGNLLKENLFIDIDPDTRWGSVRYGGEIINAKLVDLPCTIESLKTTDNKSFYKTADICQMLICSNEMEPSDEDSESPKKKKEKEKRHQHPHGIVPPLKNCRRRRFRKTLRKKPIDLASIEKEVKQLLRIDMEAIDVKWEEIFDEGPNTSSDMIDTRSDARSKPTASPQQAVTEETMFGEISSSDEDVNIDSGDEPSSHYSSKKPNKIEMEDSD